MNGLGRMVLKIVITVIVWLALLTLTVCSVLILFGLLWAGGQVLGGCLS